MELNDYLKEKEITDSVSLEDLRALMTEFADTKSKEDNLRLLADLDNMRKRQKSVEEDIKSRYLIEGLNGLMSVSDDLNSAISTSPVTVGDGLRPFEQKIRSILKTYGVDVISDDYDPDVHEVIHTIQNTNLESPKIRTVVNVGYKYNGKVIRHPKVILETP